MCVCCIFEHTNGKVLLLHFTRVCLHMEINILYAYIALCLYMSDGFMHNKCCKLVLIYDRWESIIFSLIDCANVSNFVVWNYIN